MVKWIDPYILHDQPIQRQMMNEFLGTHHSIMYDL